MHRTVVLSERLWPRAHAGRDALLIVAGSLFVALCAQIRVDLPFTPVPITGQTLGVLLVGAALGARRGALSLMLYLAEGAMGWPVFAGGAAGALYLLGPTGGYLVGFVPAAWLVGALAERGWDRRPGRMFLTMALGNAVIYLLGVLWLARFVGLPAALVKGMVPFLPGDALKILLATGALPSVWRLLGER